MHLVPHVFPTDHFLWAQDNVCEPCPDTQPAYGYGWTDQRHLAKVGSCSQDCKTQGPYFECTYQPQLNKYYITSTH